MLASGNNGFDFELAFQIAVQVIKSFEPDYLEDTILVLFTNHAAEQVRKKGYTVSVLPRDLTGDLELQKNSEKSKRLMNDVKGLTSGLVEEQLQKGVDYFKNPKNREKALKNGKEAVRIAMTVAKFF